VKRKAKKYDRYDRTAGGKYRAGKRSAKARGLAWALTLPQYEALIAAGRCHYCAGVLDPKGSSLDRLDSGRGYEAGNVVACCWRCNRIKAEGITEREMRVIAAVLKVVKEWE